MLPNPTMFSINEVVFGVTSVDVLWSLKSQEFFRRCTDAEPAEPGTEPDPLAKDVMARTCRHLLRQRRCASSSPRARVHVGTEGATLTSAVSQQLLPRVPLAAAVQDARRAQPRRDALRPRQDGELGPGHCHCAVDPEALYARALFPPPLARPPGRATVPLHVVGLTLPHVPNHRSSTRPSSSTPLSSPSRPPQRRRGPSHA